MCYGEDVNFLTTKSRQGKLYKYSLWLCAFVVIFYLMRDFHPELKTDNCQLITGLYFSSIS